MLVSLFSEEKDGDEILELILLFMEKGYDGMDKMVTKILNSRKLINWKVRGQQVSM